MKSKKIYILAYPDNPVGVDFLRAFIRHSIPVAGLIIEQGAGGGGFKRMQKKIQTDGLIRTGYRLFQMYKMKWTKTTVIDLAEKIDIPIHRVIRFNSKSCEQLLSTLDIDLFVIASAPILKKSIFSKAKLGCLNAHPGWLPAYRGLGATANALKNGDPPGVTVHYIDDGIDTGPIITRERVPIYKNDTIAKVNDRAVAQGADLMAKVILDMQIGQMKMLALDEPAGKNYGAMPYKEARKINRALRKRGDKDAV